MNYFKISALVIALFSTASYSQDSLCYQECLSQDPPPTDAECRRLCTVTPGQGNPLQLFSYELIGPAPVIDGSLMSRDGDPTTSESKDEWKAAASRTLILNDSGIAQLFLVNTSDTLYVGLTYEHGNNGNGSGVVLYFDEGVSSPPAALDGGSDLALSSPGGLCNEQSNSVISSGGLNLADRCWKDTAWVNDGDGAADFRAARYFYNSSNKVHHSEFAIPLNNGKTDDATNSDLDVLASEIVGFYLEVIKSGTGAGTFHWRETNGNRSRPDTLPYWGRIQLSVKRTFFTFYTGRSAGPKPVINGRIDEPIWNGADQRNLILSNYHYGSLKAKYWGLEDSAGNEIYVGVRVFDSSFNANDFCQIYLEEVGENTTDSIRDYDLDGNAENSLRVTGGGQFGDYYWNIGAGLWQADTEAPDSQAAVAQRGAGYTDFEFRVLRTGGAQDIDIPGNGLLGFLIRFRDGDQSDSTRADYYWEYTTNNDAQLLSRHQSPFAFLATGWNNLQLGGPYIEVRSPTENQNIWDSVLVEVFVGNITPVSVQYYAASDTSVKRSLTNTGGGVWRANWNLSAQPVGGETLVIQVRLSNGSVFVRLVPVIVIAPPVGLPPSRRSGPGQISLDYSGSGSFRIGLEKPGNVNLQLWDLSGKLVWNLHLNDLARGYHRIAWPPAVPRNGIYFMALSRGQQRIVRRVPRIHTGFGGIRK